MTFFLIALLLINTAYYLLRAIVFFDLRKPKQKKKNPSKVT